MSFAELFEGANTSSFKKSVLGQLLESKAILYGLTLVSSLKVRSLFLNSRMLTMN